MKNFKGICPICLKEDVCPQWFEKICPECYWKFNEAREHGLYLTQIMVKYKSFFDEEDFNKLVKAKKYLYKIEENFGRNLIKS